MKEVLINAGAGETRVAIVEDGRLEELFLERTIGLDEGHVRKKGGRHGHSLIGNIILGRVQRVLPGMQAAFVDVGLDRAGFLARVKHAALPIFPASTKNARPRSAIACTRARKSSCRW